MILKRVYELDLIICASKVSYSADAAFVLVGTYLGDLIILASEGLKYHTMIHLSASKITAIEYLPPMEGLDIGPKILVTSNDSKLRLLDLRDKGVSKKFKGHLNREGQVRASFSDDGHFVICGSEDKSIYIWNTVESDVRLKEAFSVTGVLAQGAMWLKEATKLGNSGKEFDRIEVSDSVVTCAIFAPRRTRTWLENSGHRKRLEPTKESVSDGRFIIVADQRGRIRVFENESELDSKVKKVSTNAKSNLWRELLKQDGTAGHQKEFSNSSIKSCKSVGGTRTSTSSLDTSQLLLHLGGTVRQTGHSKDFSNGTTFVVDGRELPPVLSEKDEIPWVCGTCGSGSFALLKGCRIKCLGCNAVGLL